MIQAAATRPTATIPGCRKRPNSWHSAEPAGPKEPSNRPKLNASSAEACVLQADNKIQRAILEARLLAGETYDEIARHSGIPAAVVQAYEQLFFNVTNQICFNQICGSLVHPGRLLLGLLPNRDIGSHLQMQARTEGAESVEATAELLARLDGKTFADGLPAEAEVGRRWDRLSRLGLIRGLGLFKPKQQKLIQTLVGTSPSMMIAMQTATDETLPLWDELLSQIPVPKDIRDYAIGLKKAAPQKKAATEKTVTEEGGRAESDSQQKSGVGQHE